MEEDFKLYLRVCIACVPFFKAFILPSSFSPPFFLNAFSRSRKTSSISAHRRPMKMIAT